MVENSVHLNRSATTRAGQVTQKKTAFMSRWEGHKHPKATADKLYIAVRGKMQGMYRVYPFDPAEPPALWHQFQGWCAISDFGDPFDRVVFEHENYMPAKDMLDLQMSPFDNIDQVRREMKRRGFKEQVDNA